MGGCGVRQLLFFAVDQKVSPDLIGDAIEFRKRVWLFSCFRWFGFFRLWRANYVRNVSF